MTLDAVLFYLIAAFILVSTAFAITRRNLVHVVVFLVFSFLGTALLFYLLGAPFLAALEVIIYAGAIMILFLFVIMMLRMDADVKAGLSLRRWVPSGVLGLLFLILSALMIFRESDSARFLMPAMVAPRAFGRFIFEHYWLAVEMVSILLLLGLLAVVQLGSDSGKKVHPPENVTGKTS